MFDSLRLADVVCHVPSAQEKGMVSVIEKTRELCFKEAEVHPLTQEQRQFEQLQEYCQLIPSPRHLQRVLRSTYMAWKRIPGEVNWSDLFILRTFELVFPVVYRFVQFYYDKLVSGEDTYAQWGKTLAYAGLTPHKSQLASLIRFCFPHFGGETAKQKGWVVQSINKEKYFWRAINEMLGSDEVSDQKVLWDLEEWFNGNEEPLRNNKEEIGGKYIEVVKDWMEQFADYKGDKQRLADLKKLVDG